ncbi:hypothetical protein [Streptomyces sp. NPDC048419]|uniref:hypothetical protein n=1 Tax=Streptomyces sp. NPDC048419 TaxID=3365547 RepID=UPI00371BD3E5
MSEGVGGVCTAVGVDDGEGVIVPVGVDTDDVVDLANEHGQRALPLRVGIGLRKITERPDCDPGWAMTSRWMDR